MSGGGLAGLLLILDLPVVSVLRRLEVDVERLASGVVGVVVLGILRVVGDELLVVVNACEALLPKLIGSEACETRVLCCFSSKITPINLN